MPIPRLFLVPVPIVIATGVCYQYGLLWTKPQWYREHQAREYFDAYKQYRNFKAGERKSQAAAESDE